MRNREFYVTNKKYKLGFNNDNKKNIQKYDANTKKEVEDFCTLCYNICVILETFSFEQERRC